MDKIVKYSGLDITEVELLAFADFWSGTISSGDCVSRIPFYDEEGTQEVLIIYLSIWKMESSFYMT